LCAIGRRNSYVKKNSDIYEYLEVPPDIQKLRICPNLH